MKISMILGALLIPIFLAVAAPAAAGDRSHISFGISFFSGGPGYAGGFTLSGRTYGHVRAYGNYGRFYGTGHKQKTRHFSKYDRHRPHYRSYGRSSYDHGYRGRGYGYFGSTERSYYRNPYRFKARSYGYRNYHGYRSYCR